MRVRIVRCTTCRRRGHNRQTCPKPRYPGKYFHHGRWRGFDEEPSEQRYHGLDDYILRHVGRVPVPTRELYMRVVDDYGPIGQRTFVRHLKALREAKRLTATPLPDYQGFSYAR